jgi:hypothetical protein
VYTTTTRLQHSGHSPPEPSARKFGKRRSGLVFRTDLTPAVRLDFPAHEPDKNDNDDERDDLKIRYLRLGISRKFRCGTLMPDSSFPAQSTHP